MNNKKILCICIVVLVLVLIIMMILIRQLAKISEDSETNVSGTEYYGESEDTLEGYFPRGLTNLTKKYEGTLENTEIQETTSNFIRTVFEINDSKEDTDYYKENANKLLEFGITSEKQFDEIKKKIVDLNKEELEYKLSKFDINSIKEEDNYLTVDLIIELKDGTKLVFKEKFQIDYDSSKLKFIFS